MVKYIPVKRGFAWAVVVLLIGVSIIPLTSSKTVEKPVMSTFDDMPPEISDVTLIHSIPKDTEPFFGWENFSCIVTDDGMLDVVQINFTYTKTYFHPWIWEEYFNFPMNNIDETYYYNTTLADAGDYTYHIWATDSNGNQNSTLPESFFLPLNADIDMNVYIGFVDIMSVTGRWMVTGTPGWIRPDINNDGFISFPDIMSIAFLFGYGPRN